MLDILNICKYDKFLSASELMELQQLYEKAVINIKADIFIPYYLEHTSAETAKYFNIGKNTVTRLALEYNCAKNIKKHLAKPRKLITKDLFYEKYIVDNLSVADTAAYFGVNNSTIVRLMNDYRIFKHSTHKEKQNRLALNVNSVEFIQYYAYHSAEDTKEFFNLDSVSQVHYLCKKFKADLNKSAPREIIRYCPTTGDSEHFVGSAKAADALIQLLKLDPLKKASIARAIRRACSSKKLYKNFL